MDRVKFDRSKWTELINEYALTRLEDSAWVEIA